MIKNRVLPGALVGLAVNAALILALAIILTGRV